MDPQSAAEKAVAMIGLGYDLTADVPLSLSACKAGPNWSRVIQLDGNLTQELVFPGGAVVSDVPAAIKCDKGERIRFCSDALDFDQMAELINQELSLSGKIPSGLFNAMFNFEGCWKKDAAGTKVLAFDGWFISLYNVELERSQIRLSEKPRQEIPSSWDPAALAEFIKRYGTHIVAGVKMGGKDVIHFKQLQSSKLDATEVQKLLKQLADDRFSEENTVSLLLPPIKSSLSPKDEESILRSSVTSYSKNEMQDIISNHIRCGGIDKGQSHSKWLSTISQSPDVISISFVPIVSLLSGVQGTGFLSYAVNMYLRYKPPIEKLQEFLELSSSRQWAPVYGDLPLALHLKNPASPSLQFTFMGPKLFVNTEKVDSMNHPVTGIRLYLEGKRSDRLAIHLQHLKSLSPTLQVIDIHGYEPLEEAVKQGFMEPVRWSMFSHICTAPVEYHGAEVDDCASIVTKAWLEVKSIYMKKVLFLRLGYSMVPSAKITTSEWNEPISSSPNPGVIVTFRNLISAGETKAQKPADVNINSAVYPDGPPWPTRVPKLTHFVDTKEMFRSSEDRPGHWVVTGAKLCMECGKIAVKVKYSLFSLCHSLN
ncbi:hypothetical protein ACH5RR_015156 [Cinchona calisaya]|uniref:MACPF domain-containing protein n=1 Tax=Cinchona calisaya TaxID=153742 RepID=A0ABD2ZV16_9GENT